MHSPYFLNRSNTTNCNFEIFFNQPSTIKRLDLNNSLSNNRILIMIIVAPEQ